MAQLAQALARLSRKKATPPDKRSLAVFLNPKRNIGPNLLPPGQGKFITYIHATDVKQGA